MIPTRSFALLLWLTLMLPVSGQEVLTRCADIRALSREQAAEGRAVRLSGVITSGQKARGAFVLSDDTAGIYVTPGQRDPTSQVEIEWMNVSSLEPGGRVEVQGFTGAGGFAPLVVAQRVVYLGRGELPPARAVTLTELRTGAFDCQQAELRGVVRRWHRDEDSGQLWLQVAEQGGTFSAIVDDAAELDGMAFVDAEVRLNGTCFSFFNTRGEIVGARLRVASPADIAVTAPALTDPFAAPEVSALALRPFRSGPSMLHRQRLAGVVTLCRPGELVYVQTRQRGFRVNTRGSEVFTPGDVVEAAGFVEETGHFAAMDEALVRKTGRAEMPNAVPVSCAEILLPKVNQGRDLRVEDYDGALVALRGRLVRLEALPGHKPRLYLDCEGTLILAELGLDADAALLAHLPMESEVEVTGVCSVTLDQGWPADVMPAPASFSLLLRDVNDLRVVRAPSWWTRQRVLGLLAVVAALAAVIGSWAIALRRRVQAQTEIIRNKIERESVLGERERIARELHDTVEQELMGVNMLLEETKTHLPGNADRAVETLALAHRMLRHCREESRSSIRDLRSVALENLGLPAALEELLRPVAVMNGAQFTVMTEGQHARLSTSKETALLRLCHEAVANAARHSGAANISLRLCYAPGEVSAVIQDDGKGFNPQAPRPTGGHFGLLGMEERADKIGARLKIESTPGQGTQIRITLPLR
ncbi:MAG: sensor histidine kinase [Verrucomicrobiaceae bacterium]|nr:sensor histidine kinase [Verrucomicrobiaceae bacterium]